LSRKNKAGREAAITSSAIRKEENIIKQQKRAKRLNIDVDLLTQRICSIVGL